jgi:hypothetical protein
LWRRERRPQLTVEEVAPGHARIRAGDAAVVDILRGDAADGDVVSSARKLRDVLDEALRTRPEAAR